MINLNKVNGLLNPFDSNVGIGFRCAICGAFPTILVNKANTAIWKQDSHAIPSNRICVHIKHILECPHCEISDFLTAEEEREKWHIDPKTKRKVLERDNYTCQACGYKETQKPIQIARQMKGETDEEYLYRRFKSTLARHGMLKVLHVAHYHRKYASKETHANRDKASNARTLCSDCHNIETSNHYLKRWMKRMKECPTLKKLK